MNVLQYAALEEREGDDRSWFSVQPGEVYPAALEELADAVQSGQAPKDPPLASLYARAAALGPEGLRLGTEPRDALPDELVPVRAEALEIARLWFTEQLHQAVEGRPIGLHIARDDAWKL
jgi:hypothetical protein